MHIVASVQTCQFISKCRIRQQVDPVWSAILAARLGTFLTQHVEAYCRIHRLWSNSFWQLRRSERPEYQGLVQWIERFLAGLDEQSQGDTIHAFARELIATACSLLGEDPSTDLAQCDLPSIGPNRQSA